VCSTTSVQTQLTTFDSTNRAANKQGGSIINIASIIGKIGNLGQANYSASKGGVISFSKTAAKELARDKIRVNAVLPGFINTPMAQAVPEKVKEKIYPNIPLGRFGEAEEIADMVVFLASDRSKYVTGAVIEVTGGYHM
jgi:NAD(P)-dependent dehydrogenase (short-subunit alcohol dehydrogenase family)